MHLIPLVMLKLIIHGAFAIEKTETISGETKKKEISFKVEISSFSRYPNIGPKTELMNIKVIEDISPVKCARECQKIEECWSFFFYYLTVFRYCELLSDAFNLRNSVNHSNADYYVIEVIKMT